jgi:hypothetical protein
MGSAANQPWGSVAGKAVDTWDTCPHCNCKEGQLHNKFCPTQLSVEPKWLGMAPLKTEGEGICDCAAPDDNDVYYVRVKEEYYDLFDILCQALEQAQDGKGSERHGNGLSFTEQPALTITRAVGRGFPLGQAMKKIQESQRMDDDAAKRELLGAINYLVAAILSFDD